METMRFDLEELHGIQMEMLKTFAAVCEEEGLTWFLGFGSLLGAARNHKIIEWDDSIDAVMPWRDYQALSELPAGRFGKELFLQTYETDPGYPRYYAKLRKNGTTLIKAEFANYDMHHGIYINIIPLIKMADDEEAGRRQIRDAKRYKLYTEDRRLPRTEKTLWFASHFLLKMAGAEKKKELRDKMKARVLQYEGEETVRCFALAGVRSLNLPLRTSWFESSVLREFEGMDARIPKGWHEWLTLRYGNYMEVPIADLQGNKIADFVALNTKKPYTDYKGKAYCRK